MDTMNVQLAYQMRETRLAKATVAQLQRQLADEQRSQIEMQLNDELFTAMTRLTDKVINQCLFHTSFFFGGGFPPPKNLQFPRPKRLPICVLENFFSVGVMNFANISRKYSLIGQ